MSARTEGEGHPAIEARGLAKRFGETVAVADASATFERGRVHAVAGENGAGKSTLLRMAAGLAEPDSGVVLIDGVTLDPHTPREAIARGVSMVEQHFSLVGVLDAVENVVLGEETTRGLRRLDLNAARSRVRALSKELDAEIPLDVPVETLGVGDHQRIEIVRALYRSAKTIILDEPTTVLTPIESATLYATLRKLADAGRAIIVVTHKLDEVRVWADAVTVMRRGKILRTRDLASLRGDEGALREAMDDVTRAIMGESKAADAPAPRKQGDRVVSLRDVALEPGLAGVSFEVRAGEIVGVAGVEGNGQRELVRVLAGDTPSRGRAEITGTVAVVHEDRRVEGLVLDASVRDNLLLGGLAEFGPMLDPAAMDAEATKRLERIGATALTKRLARPAATLSGGNQQKIVLARALAIKAARVLVCAHPTRGVDVGASRGIRSEIAKAAARGLGVVVVSADLDELRALADRILVLARGKIAAELPPTATDEALGRAMLGTRADASPDASADASAAAKESPTGEASP